MSEPIFSNDGDVPEIDLSRCDLITSLVTTFESEDLSTRNVLNFYYDEKRDYVFLEIMVYVNGKITVDQIMGYDKDKIISSAGNIMEYFDTKGELKKFIDGL